MFLLNVSRIYAIWSHHSPIGLWSHTTIEGPPQCGKNSKWLIVTTSATIQGSQRWGWSCPIKISTCTAPGQYMYFRWGKVVTSHDALCTGITSVTQTCFMETDLEFRLEVNWNWTNSDFVCDVLSRVIMLYLTIQLQFLLECICT